MFRRGLDSVGTYLGMTIIGFSFFSASVPSLAQKNILAPRTTSSESSLITATPRIAGTPKLALDGRSDFILDKSQARAEVSQRMSEVDAPVVEEPTVGGERKKFLGGLFLYMLLKAQER